MSRIGVGKEDAQAFVKSLKDFSDTLLPEQQAMLGTILDAAQQDETAGYGRRFTRSEEDETAGEDDTAGYGRRFTRSEEDETAGYGYRTPRRDEGPEQGKEERWGRLVEWLAVGEGGNDETEGFAIKK